MRILLGLVLLAASLLAHPFDRNQGSAQAQQIVLPCVPSGNSCIPVSAANPLPTTGGGSSSLVIGTTPITGGATTQVLYNLGAVVSSDAGFTYSGTQSGVVLLPDGAASPTVGTPGFAFVGATAVGFRRNSTTGIIFTASGADIWRSSASTIALRSNAVLGFTATSDVTGGTDTSWSRGSAGGMQLGAGDSTSAVAQTLQVQNIAAGNMNVGGADWILNGSKSTGTGVGGKIKLQATLTGTTGTTQNSNFPMVTINPGAAAAATVQFGDGTNFTTYDSCTALTTSATGVIACTASAIRFKELYVPQPLNLAGLDALRVDIPWRYREDAGHGLDPSRLHVGLFADEVVAMDPRCGVWRDGETEPSDYEDRCVIDYLVGAVKSLRMELHGK